MLSLIARYNRTALAASSAALASASVYAFSQRKEEDPSTTSGRSKSVDFTTSVCSCDALKVPTVKRQQTMVWLGKTSSKASLESRYKVDWKQPLGEGGYGAVYLCADRETGERRALKMIPKAYTNGDSFQREMDALLRVRDNGSHPNICSLRESFEKRGNYYLVLDLIEGGEMFEHLAANGAYSEQRAARLARETASALAFLHGIGLVHADLKPENLMLSTKMKTNSVVKLVDFGCSEVFKGSGVDFRMVRENTFTTQAYSPPEAFSKHKGPLQPSFDMWALGCVLYIMLVGRHPFDPTGMASDEEIEQEIKKGSPPLRGSPYTKHLSDSAVDLLERLLHNKPYKRLTAMQMLEHPWTKGMTARTDEIKGIDTKLNAFRKYKSQLEVKVFADWVAGATSSGAKKASLIENAFKSFDTTNKGYVTLSDISRSLTGKKDDSTSDALGLSGFTQLLGNNMENKHFPEGYRIFKEGSKGDAIYFINSGVVEVSTKAGFNSTLSQGQMFGEGALLEENSRRSATVTCKTPVHVVRISKKFYQKYMKSIGSDSDTNLTIREHDRSKHRERALKIMRLQKRLVERRFNEGDTLYTAGDEGSSLFIIDKGLIKILGQDILIPPGEVVGEHALLTGLPRNATVVCSSEECVAYEMSAKDFAYLLSSSPSMKKSFRDICFRRDFQKAIAKKFGKEFGKNEQELKQAFDAMDLDGSGGIGLSEVKELFQMLYPTLGDDDPIYMQALQSLDLEGNELISFDEFKKVLLKK